MKLRFKESSIPQYAAKYKILPQELILINLKDLVFSQGFLNKDQLRIVAKWKSPRSAGYMEKNSPAFVKEITGFSLNALDEKTRIEILTILDGVSWPTVSVILHFFHKDPYPILDFRALWSASVKVPSQYDFKFWWEYVEFCRNVAKSNKIDMRTLDRAMWHYSKEKQNFSG